MNINMLRDVDNDAGFYVAACGTTTPWRGATLFVSADAGANYSPIATLNIAATIGYATNALGDFVSGNIVDEINSVSVRLSNGTLSSTDRAGLLAEVNACVLGSEILLFRDATLEMDGTYTLRGLLRGRRGSEYAMGAHAAGDRFVLLSESALIRVDGVTADFGVEKLYKAVTSGSTLADTAAQAFTNEGAGLKPYSVAQLGGGRNDAGDVLISWRRRARVSGEWRDAVDVPLGEVAEEYVLEVYTDNTYVTLARTIGGLTSASATYTAAQQTADFGSPQSSVHVRVYQLSAIVGRGYSADATI